MKYSRLFYLLIFISIPSLAQNYTTYSLYDNTLQAIFPSKPEAINVNIFTLYLSVDKKNKMSFIAKSLPCSFVCEVGKYDKKEIDDSIVKGMKIAGVKIISFDSHIDKKQYIAITHFEDTTDGVVFNRSKKIMISKKGDFEWTVSYVDPKYKKIFNTYQSSVQIVNK